MAETRIVTRQRIPRLILDRFRSILSLPEEKLRQINQWAKTRLRDLVEGEIQDPELRSTANEIGITQPHLLDAISLIVTAVFSGESPGSVDIEYFISALQEGSLGNMAEGARVLFNGIEMPSREAEYIRQKQLAAQSVIATLRSADVLCDLRAVFRRFPSPSRSETHEKNAKALLGFEPIILVSLQLSDPANNNTMCTFQATEKVLTNLLKTLEESLTQLKILKGIKPSIPLAAEES